MKPTAKKLFLSILIISFSATISAQQNKSQWVYKNAGGKLQYKKLEKGNRIIDFSYAGYMGGGVSLPDVPARITLTPAAGDNTDAIQNAINQLAKMPLTNGFRGTVLLSPGTYDCERTITINASGVVLRGSGPGEKGTIINMTGKPHACIVVRSAVNVKPVGEAVKITDTYVPSASNNFPVTDASIFHVGDTIRITKPVTDAWVAFMGMDKLTRDGKKQTWITGEINTERVITNISQNKITVDFPLTDSYDSQYLNPPGVTVQKIETSGMITQVGVENFRIVSPAQSVTINEGHHRALTMGGITDGWVRNIDVFNTVNSMSFDGKRITVDHVNILHTVPTIGAAKPADLNGSGPQILFNKCSITGDNVFFLATGAKVSGPVVLLNCVFKGNGWIQPHQRWATGILIDNCEVPDGGIDFMNRGAMGSGHGWAIGWGVAWNCKAKSYLNQQPPGAANWVIGSTGEQQKKAIPFDKEPVLPEGLYDSHNKRVDPSSLYLAQLAERLGAQAVKNIGY
ncbi:MAG: hypothetical protein JWN76_3273 [Chitinophagaceae bacterium]|nr:hypothetical protein [Chitinophagaceae bacterium]